MEKSDLLTDDEIKSLEKELNHLAFLRENSARMGEIGRILRDDENKKNEIRRKEEERKEADYQKRFAYLFNKK